jgi:hypothetical protein
VVAAIAVTAWSMRSEAHKPITSPFTFNDDVLPIVKARCASCHSPGGVAPMSLLTHADAVPWGESIRVELMAGHMPPWGVESPAGRFRNPQQFSAREMNVLLTWASGGTPPGVVDTPEPIVSSASPWLLGAPDLALALPEVTLAADKQEQVEEFALPVPPRSVRAVDLLPGTAAIVRRATISVRPRAGDARASGATPERLLALWVPGDHPVPLDAGVGFQIPPLAELIVRVFYRKTWRYERQPMTDRSTVGLYFADEPATEVQVLRIFTPVDGGADAKFTTTVTEDLRAMAVYPDPQLSATNVTVVAARPDGSREDLIAFQPRAEWARRFWFREPIALPRGTRIEVTARFDQDLLPPAASAPPNQRPTATSVAVMLNVVRAPTHP